MTLSFADLRSYLLIFSLTISLTWVNVYTQVYSPVFHSSFAHTPLSYLSIRGTNYVAGCLDVPPPPPMLPEKFLINITYVVVSSKKNDLTGFQALITRI